ncbi:MAG: nucleotide pyrophosphohydrolase [bacterium]|nr:nucleotide pyrophosphohydrolase [bacterium]
MGEVADLTEAMHAFVASKGFYDAGTPHPQTLSNLAKSLVIEAAEVLECFQWKDVPEREHLAPELADVFLYLLQLADRAGIDLVAATRAKLEHNRDRTW